MSPRQTASERRRRLILPVWWLACGCVLTAAQVAERLGIDEERAEALLDMLSEDVPIYEDGAGKWRLK